MIENKSLPELPKERLFWHIDRFSGDEARVGVGPTSVAFEAHGSWWLMTIGPKGYMSNILKQGFAESVDDCGFSLANPGEEWQATDDLAERGLPRRRLIFGGADYRGSTFFHYELGGPERKYGVVTLHMDGNYARLDWGGVGSKPAKNFRGTSSDDWEWGIL